jgi:hypothetical protein
MSEARPIASLSSGLLARKGAAKPAMRPQAWGQLTQNPDDLGWNDMGDAEPQPAPDHVPSSIAALTPAPRFEEQPAVRDQQRAIAEELGAEEEQISEPDAPAPAPAPVFVMPQQRPAIAARDKAAFTLRLDHERHFRLRLACALTGRSAQQLVTAALDEMLTTFPEIDAMADQLPVKARARS